MLDSCSAPNYGFRKSLATTGITMNATNVPSDDEENMRFWLEEAARRDAELGADPSRGRPAESVFRDARARLESRYRPPSP
jgi:hypothetical protein